MSNTKKLAAAALAAFAALSTTAMATAGFDAKATPVVLKEGQGRTLKFGTKHTVVYFLARGGDCRTTFVVADKNAPLAAAPFNPTRFDVQIAPGKTFVMGGDERYSLQFECTPNAEALTIRPVQTLAYATN